MIVKKANFEMLPGIKLDSFSLSTVADPADSAVLAEIEIKASLDLLSIIRRGLGSNGSESTSVHAVDGTIAGQRIIQALLAGSTDLKEFVFPTDWELDVEVQEDWPRREGEIRLVLRGGQDPDAVALLLATVGIEHSYDE